MVHVRRFLVALIVPHLVAQAHARPASFTPLADLAGGTVSSRGWAVDAAGGFVVGVGNDGTDSGTLWRFSGGVWTSPVMLARLPSGGAANSRGCATNGLTAFGDANDSTGTRQAVRWAISGNSSTILLLGYPPGGGYSGIANACSADGSVACGENVYQPPAGGGPPPLPITQAFRWTSAGMVDLGTLPGVAPYPSQTTSAAAMSDDGSVIVGYANDASFAPRPWRWKQATGVVDVSGGTWTGRARGCSPDGSIVVGTRSDTGTSLAFVWTEAGGRLDLGTIGTIGSTTYDTSALFDASQSGCRCCGLCLSSTVSGSQLACIWEPGAGWRSVKQILVDAGINMTGWSLTFANSISDDGQTITGYGTNPSGQTQAWVAHISMPVPGDVNGDGTINGRDIQSFVAIVGAPAPVAGSCAADFNHNGMVDLGDVTPFVSVLLAP